MTSVSVEQKFFEIRVSNDEISKGHLVLVNQKNPIRSYEYEDDLQSLDTFPTIKQLSKGMLLEQQCLQQLHALLEDCGGIEEIIAVSAYRNKEEQTRIYQDSLSERGAEYTAKYVALPNHSEHQTGLAIDVGRSNSELDFIAPSFPETGIYKSFRLHAAQYGFILRYQREKEDITQISYEPWHFRYVGYPHSKIMEENNLCLEEYIDFLQHYRFSGEPLVLKEESLTIKIYYVPSEEGSYTTLPILDCDDHHISGNNRDGFIVTVYAKQP